MPAVTEKVVVLAPAANATEDGAVRTALPFESATDAPAAGAATERVTVQLAEAPEASVAGEQERDDTARTGETDRLTVLDVPLSAAVRVAVWPDTTVAAVAVNDAVLDPAGTVMDAGTTIAALLDESATVRPPVGAAADNATLQAVVDPDVRLVEPHCREDKDTTGAATVNVAFRELFE